MNPAIPIGQQIIVPIVTGAGAGDVLDGPLLGPGLAAGVTAGTGYAIGTQIRRIPIPFTGQTVGSGLDNTVDAVFDFGRTTIDRATGRYQTYQPLTAEEQAAMRRQHRQSQPITQPITRQAPVTPAASAYTAPSSSSVYSTPHIQSFEAMQAQWEAQRLQREQNEVDAAVRTANAYKLTLAGTSDRPASLDAMTLSTGEYSWDASERVMQEFTQEAIAFNRDESNRANGLRMIAFERTLPNSHIRVPSRVVGTAEQLARWLDPLRHDASGNYVSPLLNSWDFTLSGVDPDWARNAQVMQHTRNPDGSKSGTNNEADAPLPAGMTPEEIQRNAEENHPTAAEGRESGGDDTGIYDPATGTWYIPSTAETLPGNQALPFSTDGPIFRPMQPGEGVAPDWARDAQASQSSTAAPGGTSSAISPPARQAVAQQTMLPISEPEEEELDEDIVNNPFGALEGDIYAEETGASPPPQPPAQPETPRFYQDREFPELPNIELPHLEDMVLAVKAQRASGSLSPKDYEPSMLDSYLQGRVDSITSQIESIRTQNDGSNPLQRPFQSLAYFFGGAELQIAVLEEQQAMFQELSERLKADPNSSAYLDPQLVFEVAQGIDYYGDQINANLLEYEEAMRHELFFMAETLLLSGAGSVGAAAFRQIAQSLSASRGVAFLPQTEQVISAVGASLAEFPVIYTAIEAEANASGHERSTLSHLAETTAWAFPSVTLARFGMRNNAAVNQVTDGIERQAGHHAFEIGVAPFEGAFNGLAAYGAYLLDGEHEDTHAVETAHAGEAATAAEQQSHASRWDRWLPDYEVNHSDGEYEGETAEAIEWMAYGSSIFTYITLGEVAIDGQLEQLDKRLGAPPSTRRRH